MLPGTRLLNLNVVRIKSGTYCHSKWSEYMVTNHKRCFSLKSHLKVNNPHRVTYISGRHSAFMILPNAGTLCSINFPASYREISTARMSFCICTPFNSDDPLNENSSKQLHNEGNDSSIANSIPVQNLSSVEPALIRLIVAVWGIIVTILKKIFPSETSLSIIGGALTIMGVCIGVGVGLVWRENQSKVADVDKAIKRGSLSELLPIDSPVDRHEKIDEIKSCFIDKKDADEGTSFGVIFGRIGTGKTRIVKEACHRQPGVLYCKIKSMTDVTKCLAEVSGMRTEPTLIGILMGGLISTPIGYYKLKEFGVPEVINVIAERSEKLKEKFGRPACLFIDGVDIIAKNDQKLFMQLVDLAKGKANDGSLRMILVSSENFPLLKENLPQTRWDRVEVIEINDITEDQAVDYLDTAAGLSNELAKHIVHVVGPRLLFCHLAKQKCSSAEMKNAQDTFDSDIMTFLQSEFVSSAADAFVMGTPTTARVIEALKKEEAHQLNPRAFLAACKDEKERKKLKRAMDELVEANVLWYSQDSTVIWDNKLVRDDILKRLKKSH